MVYTIQTTVRGSFDEVVDETIDALEDEGFGVLTDVDVQATFAEKLDEEFRQYRILGACNPGLAHEALGEEIELGALLPCNVVVYETDEGAIAVNAVDAIPLLDLAESSELDAIGKEVHERYERVVETIDESLGDSDA
ncbi:hypothetical protein Halru_0487 [Halovivax ruber XH-70]|uniref:DUF302 domain-containing protein n=1 Tax=Halovivax ruber (strain DSM 18193 / JCM 13892 / XH-70) TaxID=797302 RepID=L0IAY9_HALRX|nr:DUF302 domain-containing protein [Halovivax ruber]AGB15122.1 hypothetical protein Halru_0487 [Halovivax ruber XH-70]